MIPPAAAVDQSPVESMAATIRRLAGAQKSNAGAPAYSRWVNRPAGRVLAAAAYHVGLTPNAVTLISAAWSFTGIGVLCLVATQWWTGLVVTTCLLVGYAFDSADGQLARLRGGGTPAGEWLDHMVDATKISSLHLAVLVSLYRFFDLASAGWYLVPIALTVIMNTTFFGLILTEQLKLANRVPTSRSTGSWLRSVATVSTDYGLHCLIFLLLGWHHGFLAAYCMLAVCNAIFCAKWIKWFHDMTELREASE
jgi:phosphatidylglycerophosphate synthase